MQPPEAAMNQRADASTALPNSVPWAHRLTLLGLLCFAITTRFLCLVRKPFWFDECFSVEVARVGWHNFLRLLWWREANMSLYYLLLRIWLRAGLHHSQSEFFIRSLSVLIAAASLPCVYWLARLLYDRRVALIAAALFAFNAYSVRYSQEARSYALFLLLATLSSAFLIAYLRAPARRLLLGYVLVSILPVYAHFYALLLLAVQGLATRWLGCSGLSRDISGAPISAQIRRGWAAIGVGVLPLLVFVAKTGAGPIRWIQRPSLGDLLRFYEQLSGGSNWLLAVIFAGALLAAVVPHGRRLWTRDQGWETWRVQFLLLWLFFPVLLTFLLSFARPVFLGRYMIFCLPALVIVVAAGVSRLRKWSLLAVALAGMLLLGGQGISFVYGHDFDAERDASGAATNFILDHSEAEDAVVFHIAETRIPYEFFRSLREGEDTASPRFSRQVGPEILFPRHGAGLDYRDFTGKPTEDFLRTATSGHPRVWIMLMNNGSVGNPDATTMMLTRVLPEQFPEEQRWEFTKVEVRLYSK
jgi:hypothetical protein